MRERVRFVLVTDDIDFALADIFASSRSNAPAFVRITDDPIEILALPERCKVHAAIWTGARMESGAEMAWRERRMRGDLVFLSDEEMEKIAAWRARRANGGRAIETVTPDGPAPAPMAPSFPIQQWT